jgi:hypothetical protein
MAGVRANPNVDNRLRGRGGAPLRLGLTPSDKAALVAFLGTLADSTMIAAAKSSNPFRQTRVPRTASRSNGGSAAHHPFAASNFMKLRFAL